MAANDEELPLDIEPEGMLGHEFLSSLMPSERMVIEYHIRAAWREFLTEKLRALSKPLVAPHLFEVETLMSLECAPESDDELRARLLAPSGPLTYDDIVGLVAKEDPEPTP